MGPELKSRFLFVPLDPRNIRNLAMKPVMAEEVLIADTALIPGLQPMVEELIAGTALIPGDQPMTGKFPLPNRRQIRKGY